MAERSVAAGLGTGTRLRNELRAFAVYGLFFAVWFGTFMLLKLLILEEYQIEFRGVSAALVGALILAKVVLLLEHFSLGPWVERQPAWVDVALRTALYALGVLALLLLEKAFELRHAAGGMGGALFQMLKHEHMPHVIANTICASGALLVFNAMSVVQEQFGPGGLGRLFLAPRSSH